MPRSAPSCRRPLPVGDVERQEDAMVTEPTFAQLIVEKLRAKSGLWKTLTGHTTLTGGGRERAFAELLRQLVPRRFEVLEGAIATPGKRTRRQVDVMVVDT